MDHYWLVMIRKAITLNTSQALPKEKSASVSDDVAVKAVINTESASNMYEAKIEKYREKLLDYDNKYS